MVVDIGVGIKELKVDIDQALLGVVSYLFKVQRRHTNGVVAVRVVVRVVLLSLGH